MTSNSDTEQQEKNIPCQALLKERPTCSGWVRRKTALQEVGAMIENRLRIGRSLSNKIPWQQRYVIMHHDKLYVYREETAQRAQKVLRLSNYCQFDPITEDTSKDVPWIFRLLPIDHQQTKIEFFSVVSEEELQKWKEAIFEKLGYDDTDDADIYDVPNDDVPPTPASRTLPSRLTGDASREKMPPTFPKARSNAQQVQTPRRLPPTPSADNAESPETSPTGGLRSRKVPMIPTDMTSEPTKQPKTSPPPIAPKPGDKSASLKKPKVPVPVKALQTRKEVPESDDLEYEFGCVEAAMWYKTTDEAQAFMRQDGLPEGLYMIRKSTDGKGYTLLVICQGLPCKFKIDEDDDKKVRMGASSFDTLEALLLHFGDTNLPNKSTPLTKPHRYFVR